MALWLLITVAMMIFIGVSFIKDDINIGSHTLSKAYYPETLMASKEEDDIIIPTDTLEVIPDSLLNVPEIVPDTTVHKLLLFGDSMTHKLAMSIAKYGTKNNYKVTGVTWESSSIPGWSSSGKIKAYLDSIKPDFIIVSLGANEMGLRNFDKRKEDVKKIVDQIGQRPFIWVGPPLWKDDPGVYTMLEKALPPGVLFKTDTGIEIPRGPDHIHPTTKGAQIWADTIMKWIKHSPHPILAEKPDSGTSTKGHKFIYLHPGD